METSRVALITLVCVVFSSQKRISGAEVEMRVSPGDDVTLYCDCVSKGGLNPVWFRNCSHEHQPRLIISYTDFIRSSFPRYSFVFNKSTNTQNLQIKNVTESDQGLYYCALHEINITDSKGGLILQRDVYHHGNRSTRLSVLKPCLCDVCVSEGSVSWSLVLSVCAVCVLLSSLLSSICVYCLCTNTTKGSEQRGELITENDFQVHQCEKSVNGEFCCHTEVFYTLQKPAIKSD
ncbi:uncharacterized protein LOC131348857 [Hemibagrus wyckioides]|uniref:uncharacterized protein LOC131348857 n=1 Tax=Hemibagrus wyckioides TaxID=337641 RepID=UPI00266C82BB|nr:uncharacterized protein LOC131348857 [Hemibagrus wyckioides]